jgi:MFS family permease
MSTVPLSATRRSIGRNFRLVWSAVIVSSTGDGMFATALPLLAATLTRDPLLIAGIAVAARLPWLLLSMMTGAVADRTDRRRMMVAADAGRFVIVGLLGLAVVTDVIDIWALFVCAFLLGVGETLHVNSAQAILPALVEPDDLMQANARLASAQIASLQFVGPPLGVVLYNAAASLPFLADAVSFAGSAALVRALPDEHGVEPPTTRLRDDMAEGMRFMWGNAALRCITLVVAYVNFFYYAAVSLLVLYSTDQLHSGDVTYTALFVGGAAGTVISRFIVSGVARRLGGVGTLTLSMWIWALTLVVLAFTTRPVVAVATFVVLGVGNGLWITLANTMRQQITPDRLLGRMNAAFRTVSWGIVPLGAAFGGVVARHWGIRAPFVLAGVATLAVAIGAHRVLRPLTMALDDATAGTTPAER